MVGDALKISSGDASNLYIKKPIVELRHLFIKRHLVHLLVETTLLD